MSPFGPLFRYELTRLARRGLQPRLRAAFAGLLLIALFLSYLAAFPGVRPIQILTNLDEPLSLESTSRFGERFVVSFLFIQVVVVLLVTPALAASAFSLEKDRHAMDLLLATSLTSWEIVGGKLAARLVFVASLLLTGLPIVTLMVFFGGVDIVQLAAGYLIAFSTILSLGAFSFYLALVRPTLGSTLTRAYLIALACSLLGWMFSCFSLPALVSPLGATWVLLNGWPTLIAPSGPANLFWLLGNYAAIHLLVAAGFLALSVRRVRDSDRPPSLAERERERDYSWDDEDEPPSIPRRYRANRRRRVPRINDSDPFAWKERYFGGFFRPVIEGRVPVALVTMLLVLTTCIMCCGLSRYLVMLGFVLALTIVGVGSSASVAWERQQGTLDALLMLPRDRREVLWAKLRQSLFTVWWVPLGSLSVGTFGWVLSGSLFPAIAMLIVFAGWMLAASGLGLWLSVLCPTREQAIAWFFGIGLTVSLLMPMLGSIVESDPHDRDVVLFASFLRGLSPVMGLWNTDPRAWDFQRHNGQVVTCMGSLLAAGAAGLLGCLFASLAVRRFEQKE